MSDTLSAPFVIERTLRAPRPLVYAALTQEEHLRHWMSPAGMQMVRSQLDARVGGVFHYALKPVGMPMAPTMWGKWTFRELHPVDRVVVVVEFSNAEGEVTRHPMAPQWPLHTLSTTTLSEVEGGTLVQLEWRALNANDTETALFNASHASMAMGWTGTFGLLEQYLAQQPR